MHERAEHADPGELGARAAALLAAEPLDLDALVALALAGLASPDPNDAEVPARILERLRRLEHPAPLISALERQHDRLTVELERARQRGSEAPERADDEPSSDPAAEQGGAPDDAPPGALDGTRIHVPDLEDAAPDRARVEAAVLGPARVVDQLHWLRQVSALAEGRSSDLLVREPGRLITWLGGELERSPPRATSAAPVAERSAAEEAVLGARAALCRHRIERYLLALDALAADPTSPIDRVWHELSSAAEHLADARAVLLGRPSDASKAEDASDAERATDERASALDRAAKRVEERRRELADVLAARVAELPLEARAAKLAAWSLDLAESAQNALSFAEDANGPVALDAIELKRDTASWLEARLVACRAAAADLPRPARRRLAQAKARVRRARRRLVAEHDELTVKLGLTRRYGLPFVKRLEGLILLLILAVVVLFGMEWLLSERLTPRGYLLFDLVDAAICAVFLTELGMRLRFAPSRLRYLARSAVTDLLPALPFGLIAHGLEALTAGAAGGGAASQAGIAKAARLLRLPRFARYLRVLRPFIRVFRLFVFFQRALDHVVERARPRLDREVELFPPPRAKLDWPPSLELRFAELARASERRLRASLRALTAREHLAAVAALARHLEARLAALGPPVPEVDPILEDADARQAPARAGVKSPPVRLDQLLADLLRADAALVEESLGRALGERLGRTLSLFDVPLVRAIGPVRRVLGAKGDDPLEVAARAAREAGLILERALSVVRFFADLRGIVTGPQLVDRVGTTVVRATERPAKRLLMFGAIFGAVYFLFKGLGLLALSGVFSWINKVFVGPVIAIGAVALVLMYVGRWFKRVAGEATDVYARVSAAQFFSLLVFEKHRYLEEDLGLLWRRVIRPEVPAAAAPCEDAAVERLRAEVLRTRVGVLAERAGHTAQSVDESTDRVLLLYRDYLTGAPLHPSDTKTTQQLLGNLTMRAVVAERLRFSPREQRELAQLDLDRGGGLTGPYMWFSSITLSLAEETAKLLMEYNRYCQPLVDTAAYREEPRELKAWLARRRRPGSTESARQRRDDERERQALDHYASTAFNALHFLTVDQERDERLRQRFGDEVLELVRRDRRALARTVFGSYPLHRLPRHKRVVNPYALYDRFVARGRVVLLPLRLCGLAARLALFGVVKLGRVFRDVISHRLRIEALEIEADAGAAVRKIHRMRRPIFMACVALRARFDPEYLGVLTPGAPAATEQTATAFDDLATIEATAAEVEEMRALRRAYEDRRASFERLVRAEPAAFRVRPPAAVRTLPGAPADHESLRAAWLAYAIDYGGVRTLLEAEEHIERALGRAVQSEGAYPHASNPRRALVYLQRAIATRWWRSEDRLGRAFRIYWEARPRADDATLRERAAARRAFFLNADGVRALVLLVADKGGPGLARRAGLAQLGRAMRNPGAWTRQLVTVRAVQTLAALDLRNYQHIVLQLGDFDRDEEPAQRPGAPTAPAAPA